MLLVLIDAYVTKVHSPWHRDYHQAPIHLPSTRGLKTALLPPCCCEVCSASVRLLLVHGKGMVEADEALPLQVDRLDSLRASGPLTIARMIKNCGPQIVACVNDPECKAALDCLQACSATDQVMRAPCLHFSSGPRSTHMPTALQAWGRQLTAATLNTAGPSLLAAASALYFCSWNRCKHTMSSSSHHPTVSSRCPPTCTMQLWPLLQ